MSSLKFDKKTIPELSQRTVLVTGGKTVHLYFIFYFLLPSFPLWSANISVSTQAPAASGRRSSWS